MAQQGFASPVQRQGVNPSSFTAVANTTTATQLWTPALWTPIPAYDPQPGKIYIVRFGGILGTTGTPTLVFTPVWGTSSTLGSNTSFGASTAITCGSGLSSAPFYGEFTVAFRTVGLAAAGATAAGSGFVAVGDATTTAGKLYVMGGTIPTTVDDSAAGGISVFATWGTQNASNTLTCTWVHLLSAN